MEIGDTASPYRSSPGRGSPPHPRLSGGARGRAHLFALQALAPPPEEEDRKSATGMRVVGDNGEFLGFVEKVS